MNRQNRAGEEAGTKDSGSRVTGPDSAGQCVPPPVAERHVNPTDDDEHPDENRWLSMGKYREADQSFRDVDEMNHDFTVRRMVNRLAKYMRGDYVVNSRMEKYMSPRDSSGQDLQKQQGAKGFSDMDDQHMILPNRKRGE